MCLAGECIGLVLLANVGASVIERHIEHVIYDQSRGVLLLVTIAACNHRLLPVVVAVKRVGEGLSRLLVLTFLLCLAQDALGNEGTNADTEDQNGGHERLHSPIEASSLHVVFELLLAAHVQEDLVGVAARLVIAQVAVDRLSEANFLVVHVEDSVVVFEEVNTKVGLARVPSWCNLQNTVSIPINDVLVLGDHVVRRLDRESQVWHGIELLNGAASAPESDRV